MKKKNMIKLCKDINKIKYAMVDRWSIIDDVELLRELVENITDIQEKDIDKMVETVLYLIENEDCFVREIENEIIIRVKKMLSNKSLNSNNMLSILHDNNVLINDDGCLSHKRNIVNGLEKETDNKYHSLLVIPCTSNLQKHLFIEFKLLTNRELEPLLEDITDTCIDIITDIDIRITKIYID